MCMPVIAPTCYPPIYFTQIVVLLPECVQEVIGGSRNPFLQATVVVVMRLAKKKKK